MRSVLAVLPWAIAMLLIAVGSRFGLVADSSATTMFAIIPVLAMVALRRRTACRGFTRGGAL